MKTIRIIGYILIGISIGCPVISFALTCWVGETDVFGIAGMIRYMWIAYLFIPLGILLIVWGVILKKNKQKCLHLFVFGSILIATLALMGSFNGFFSDSISYDTDKVISIEQQVNFDLPDDVKIGTLIEDSYNQSYVKITTPESREKFEKSIEENVLWKKELSSKIRSLLPDVIYHEIVLFDCFLFYNVTKNEYNIFPPDGEYQCIFIAYDYELQRLVILDDLKVNIN